MSAAPGQPNLHQLVDRLTPAQADAVRAVVVQFVTPAGDADTAQNPRALAFVGAGASEHGITPRIDELLADGMGRG